MKLEQASSTTDKARPPAPSGDHFAAQWLILALTLALLGAVGSYSSFREHGRLHSAERERLRTLLEVAAQNIARQLEGANGALEAAGEDFLVRGGADGREVTNQKLRMLSEAMPGIRTMLITDERGVVVASSRAELMGKDFSRRDYFATPRSRPDPRTLYVSPPFETVLGAFAMTVTRVIPGRHGEFGGIFAATLDPDYFHLLLSSVLYAPGVWSSIAHGDGVRFLTVPGRAGLDRARPGSLFTLHQQSGDVESVVNEDAHVTALRTISPAGLAMDRPLVVALGRDLRGVDAALHRDLELQLALFGALVLATTLGLWWYQHRQRTFNRVVAEAAEALRRSEAQLALSSRLAALGTMTAGVAHEVNNPLAYNISNQTFALQEIAQLRACFDRDPALGGGERATLLARLVEIEEALTEALEGASRVRHIIEELRRFSHPGERRQSVDLARVARFAVKLCGPEVRRTSELIQDLRPVPQVNGDEAQLVQLLVNLLVNAAQAIPAWGTDRRVRLVVATTPAGEALLEVIDTGTGIPDQDLKRIFDPFFTTKPVGKGTGLGLAICHRVVEAHGGRISVETRLGAGTTVRVTLPGLPPAPGAVAGPSVAAAPVRG